MGKLATLAAFAIIGKAFGAQQSKSNNSSRSHESEADVQKAMGYDSAPFWTRL